MTQLIKTPALCVDFDRDARALQAQGALARMIQPVLNMVNQRLEEEKHLASTHSQRPIQEAAGK